MSILQEILTWSATIPSWQSDAVARLLAKPALDPADLDDLFALLKAAHGIPDPKGRVAKPLTADQIPAPVEKTTQVSLLAIKNLCCVNAIAPNESLPIGATGLTVIYGDNGSGKSGYTRVLKRACRARDQSELILPNANLPPGKTATPEADFEIIVDGHQPQDVHWTFGKPAPDELSALSVFDSRCARAYLDNEDDFSYVPYGLDVFEGLAKVCKELKNKLDTEFAQYTTDLTAFANLHGDTAVGKLISGLSAKTEAAQVEGLAIVTPEERVRRTTLETSLKENNPKERAATLRARAKRLATLSATATGKGALVNSDAVAKLKVLAETYRSAQAAAAIAASKFNEGEVLLPGTGGDAWRELFEAARKFSHESHPGHTFPELGEDSPCPLCQQPLQEEAAVRLKRFEEFIQQEAETNVQMRRLALHAQYKVFTGQLMTLNLDDVTYGELEGLDKELAADTREFESALGTRQELIKNAVIAHKWEGTDVDVPNPDIRLKSLSEKLSAEADALDKAADEKARSILQKEFSELEARLRLGEVKDAVLTAVGRLKHQARLKSCQPALRTTGISIKSSELAEQVVSVALENALNSEFKALGVGSLSVTLKSRGDKGKALHKLKLGLSQNRSPGDILSEGEQRAIAIGSFLAEVKLAEGKGGVIFDDPVSSLDHRRRERVAARLAAEAAVRQVIVFTHDIYFLCVLAEQANTQSVPITTQSLVRRPQGFGVAEPRASFRGKDRHKADRRPKGTTAIDRKTAEDRRRN